MRYKLFAFCIVFSVICSHLDAQSSNDKTVIITLGPDCPISQKYVHTLKEIHKTYGEVFEFVGLVPDNFSKDEISAFKKVYQLPFPVKIDSANQLIQKLNLTVTPETVLISNNAIIYKGAIDNWFYALGKNRSKPTTHYLIDAMEATKTGKVPKTSKSKAIGCLMEKH